MFGAGIYFANSREDCGGKAHNYGAEINAEVNLGKQFVCDDWSKQKEMQHITHTKLKKDYGCDSVYAHKIVSRPEYAVYNHAQVDVHTIMKDDGTLLYKNQNVRQKQHTRCQRCRENIVGSGYECEYCPDLAFCGTCSFNHRSTSHFQEDMQRRSVYRNGCM